MKQIFRMVALAATLTSGWSSYAVAQTTGTGSYLPSGPSGPTPVPPSPTLLGVYASDSPGGFEAMDTWLGRPLDFTSIHTGQASEYDFVNSPGYVLQSSQYRGTNAAGVVDSRLVSVPLFWNGGTLDAAAAGTYDADWASVAQTVLTSINGGPAPNQAIIYLRTGWEQNLWNQMPWSSTGREALYIAAFQRFVTVFRSVDTTGRFRFVWCPNVGGDPIASSYPGDAYVDVIGMDFYYGLNSLTNDPDPDAAFQEMLDGGLTAIANMAASSGKPLAFPEWGINKDGFGNYVKDFFDWCRSNNCLYVNYWDNDGDYASEVSDGSYPETGAMLRHLFNPAAYPVEPIAAPVNLSALAGDHMVTVSGAPVVSSTPVTTYYLYEGPSSGGESVVPVATSSSPYFVDSRPNGQPAFYRMGAGNALSLGYLSAEVTATPHGTSHKPLPDVALGVPPSGYAQSATASLVALSQANPAMANATISALVAPTTVPGMVAGFPNGLTLGLDDQNHLVGFSRDYYSNRYTATSTLPVPFPVDGQTPEWVRMDLDAKGATTVFYAARVVGGTMPKPGSPAWSQLGEPVTGQNHNGIYDATAEAFRVGGSSQQGGTLTGTVYDAALYVNGLLATHPKFDAQQSGTTRFVDGLSKVWTTGGGAKIH